MFPGQTIDCTVKQLGSSVIDAVFGNIRNPDNPPEVIEQVRLLATSLQNCHKHNNTNTNLNYFEKNVAKVIYHILLEILDLLIVQL